MVSSNSSLKMNTKKVLIILFIITVGIRLIYFTDALTFFYDQARDAFAAMAIWQGDAVKIMGPQTDFPGLHHGPLYWYILSPFYFLTGGSVWAARLFLIILSSLSVLFVFDLAKSLFGNKKTAIISAILFAVSFEAVQYARWMSNPAPAILTIAISFWSLDKLMNGKKWALAIFLLSWGLSIQFQIFMVYQLLVFAAIWISRKGLSLPKLSFKNYAVSLGIFLLTISTYILAEVKFKFLGIKTLFSYLTGLHYGAGLIEKLESYSERLFNLFELNIWGVSPVAAKVFAVLTVLAAIFYIAKNKNRGPVLFLFFWLISPLVVVFLNGPKSNFISLGALVPVIILTSFFLTEMKGRLAPLLYIALGVIIIGNLNLVITKNKEGETLFTVQKQMILGDELKIIDWVYAEADGKPFKLNTFTNPLFINSTWSYLFNWYGKSKYGYMPIWWGETQVNVPGSTVKFSEEKETGIEFLIIEPSSGGNEDYLRAVMSLENSRSEVVKEQKVGYFRVEKRKITRPRIFTGEDAFWIIQNKEF